MCRITDQLARLRDLLAKSPLSRITQFGYKQYIKS